MVDLSATPFYLGGSGYIEGSPFPWLVADFGLVDAIESGIVKISRLPVSDTTGRPEPKFFRLWQAIVSRLQPGEKLPGGKPKPEVVWREAQDALITLASQWRERAGYLQDAQPGQEQVPPAMIIVADNTAITELFYRNISGEQTIEGATPKLRLQGRHQLFPQVFRIVAAYVAQRVRFNGCHPCELGLETYVRRIVERLVAAIEPDTRGGEPPLLPRLNRYNPVGSTREVNFKTTRPCVATIRSHINQVVADTDSWEQAAVFRLEQAPNVVAFYARNDHLELAIPYEYLGVTHAYFPDFVVRLTNGLTLLLEIKGEEREQDRAKHQAAQRWVSAVNHWGQLGQWAFHVCRNPQTVIEEIKPPASGV